MFTGIIREIGTVTASSETPSGRRLHIRAALFAASDINVGDSISVAGTCLTVTELTGDGAFFDVVPETLRKTTLEDLSEGSRCNLETSLRFGDPVDGHLVQGHIDSAATVLARSLEGEGAERLEIELPSNISHLIARKGSICLSGVSLTVGEVGNDSFSVYLIPHTLRETTLGDLKPGDRVNVEADCLARYADRILGGATRLSRRASLTIQSRGKKSRPT
jgi:riboflavin synthase